jgi:hypothetical protein
MAVSPFVAGLRCRCPRCGEGPLFDGLLSVRESCTVCGLDLRARDLIVAFTFGPVIDYQADPQRLGLAKVSERDLRAGEHGIGQTAKHRCSTLCRLEFSLA